MDQRLIAHHVTQLYHISRMEFAKALAQVALLQFQPLVRPVLHLVLLVVQHKLHVLPAAPAIYMEPNA